MVQMVQVWLPIGHSPGSAHWSPVRRKCAVAVRQRCFHQSGWSWSPVRHKCAVAARQRCIHQSGWRSTSVRFPWIRQWLAEGCLSGTGPFRASLPACAGIFVHPVTLCLESLPASCFIDVSKASGLRSAANLQLLADLSKQNHHCDGGLMDYAVKYYKIVNVAYEIADIFSPLEKGRRTPWRRGCQGEEYALDAWLPPRVLLSSCCGAFLGSRKGGGERP